MPNSSARGSSPLSVAGSLDPRRGLFDFPRGFRLIVEDGLGLASVADDKAERVVDFLAMAGMMRKDSPPEGVRPRLWTTVSYYTAVHCQGWVLLHELCVTLGGDRCLDVPTRRWESGVPELPEVETMRRGIASAVGMRIDQAVLPQGRLRPLSTTPSPGLLAKQLRGCVIEGTERYGKRIALRLSMSAGDRQKEDRWLVIEPRMTGLLLVSVPPTQEHVRLRLSGPTPAITSHELLFWDRRGLGTLRLVNAKGLEEICGEARLGPDALMISCECFRERLCGSARAVKVALLDQHAVAGIGNLYAAEMLFLAGIDPRVRCQQISRPRWKRLHEVMQAVLHEAIELEGSTLSDATYRTALNEPGRYQARHRVYARNGQPCQQCGTVVRRIVQAQRSTFFCPKCQRR